MLRAIGVLAAIAQAQSSPAGRYGLTVYHAAFAALADALDAELITCDARIVESGACDAHYLGEGRTSLD